MIVEIEDAVDRATGGLLVLEQVHLVQGVGRGPLEEAGDVPRGLECYPRFFSTAQTVLRWIGCWVSASYTRATFAAERRGFSACKATRRAATAAVTVLGNGLPRGRVWRFSVPPAS